LNLSDIDHVQAKCENAPPPGHTTAKLMNLTERQMKHLRREAHNLKPVVTVGDKGLTDGILTELQGALDHHELIKIRGRVGDRAARDEIISSLVDSSRSILISRVGNIAALYRPRREKPRIVLPK